MEDDLFLEDDDDFESGLDESDATAWNILIVDDEPDIHAATRFALADVTFRDRPLAFFSAHSAAEAVEVIPTIDDLALIFVDVVMETDHAGLDLIRTIREELDVPDTRLILRTGQPGQAPQESVIVDYDINDYKEKTELTAERLFATTVAALRGYADLRLIQKYKEDAYATLGQETALTQQFLDFVHDPLVMTDVLMVISACNDAFATLVGSAEGDIIGLELADFLPQALVDDMAGAPADGKIQTVTGTVRADADERAAQVEWMVLGLQDGSAGGVICRINPAATDDK